MGKIYLTEYQRMSEAGEESKTFDKKDIERILGQPKITFVLGKYSSAC